MSRLCMCGIKYVWMFVSCMDKEYPSSKVNPAAVAAVSPVQLLQAATLQ